MIVNAPGLMPHIASGKLRALAVHGSEARPGPARRADHRRSRACRNSPTAASSAPTSRRPRRARSSRKLNAALNAITATPEVIAQFRQQGATAVQSTPDDAARKYDGDIARYKDIVVKAKIPPAD